MPIYEFLCGDCCRKTSILVRDISAPFTPKCSFCGSTNLSRIISSFLYKKSMQSIWDESGEPEHPDEDYYKHPENIGRWVEKEYKKIAGEELSPYMKDMIQAAREGEMPEPMKKAMEGEPPV